MSKPKIEIQGHRGCKGLMPENTLPAFKKAIELGVHTLEMDVVISKDNEVVVSHEPYMNPEICLDPSGKRISPKAVFPYNIYQLTYQQIKAFDCGSLQHPDCPDQQNFPAYKPLLSEVIEASEQKSSIIKYNIEIKSHPLQDAIFSPQPKEFLSLVLDVLREYDLGDRVNLQSFDLRTLEEIKRQSPDMIIALLVDEDEAIDEKLASMSFRPEIVSPHFNLLSAELVKSLKQRGFKIIPWTVNEVEQMEQMIEWETDAIITDYPNILKELLTN